MVDTPIIAEPEPAMNRRVVHRAKNQSLFNILTPLLQVDRTDYEIFLLDLVLGYVASH